MKLDRFPDLPPAKEKRTCTCNIPRHPPCYYSPYFIAYFTAKASCYIQSGIINTNTFYNLHLCVNLYIDLCKERKTKEVVLIN